LIKRILSAICLFLLVVFGAGVFLLFTEAGLRVSKELAATVSGGLISIGDAAGKISGDWLLRDIIITTDTVDIAITEFSCRWEPSRLREKNLHIGDLRLAGVGVEIKNKRSTGDSDPGTAALPTVFLPIPFLIGTLQIDDIQVSDESGRNLFDARSFSARLAGDGDHLVISQARLDAPYMGVTGSGSVHMSEDWPLSVSARWWFRSAGCGKFSGTLKGRRTLTDPVVHLALTEPDEVVVDAELSGLLTGLSYQLTVSGQELDPAGFCLPVAGGAEDLLIQMGGDLNTYVGSGQADIAVNDIPQTEARVTFSGNREQLTIDSGSFTYGPNRFDIVGSLHFGSALGWNATLSARGLDISELLPIPQTFFDGNLNVYGTVDESSLSYDADLDQLGITILDHNLEIGGGLSLHGDGSGLSITQSNFVCGEGSFGVHGRVEWSNELSWEAEILLESFNPAVIEILPEGSISGGITSVGGFEDGQFGFQADISSLHGELAGYELAGKGLVAYRGQKFSVEDLNITNGSNSFYAEGEIDTDYSLSFSLKGTELERVFPLLGGTLNVDGDISGPRREPLLRVTADGKNIVYKDHGFKTLRGEARTDFSTRTIDADLDFGKIRSGSIQAERLALDLSGALEQHAASAVLTLPEATVSVDVNGAVVDERWQGAVDRLLVSAGTFGAWQNRDPIRIDAGADLVTLDEACLFSGTNGFCTDARWEQGSWSLDADEISFDLAALNRWGMLETPLTGVVQGALSARGRAAELLSLNGSVRAGTVDWEPGENPYYQDFRWFNTSCSFELADRDLIVDVSTRFVDNSALSGQVQLAGVADIDDIARTPLSGQASVNLNDLKPLSVVTGEFLVPQGNLSGVVTVEGTLANPRFAGDVKLRDGGFHIPLLGVDLDAVQGAVGFNGNRLELDLDSRAGRGKLSTRGSFSFGAEEWAGQLDIVGSNCRLLDRRAISADASPDLDLQLGPDGGSLTGTVEIMSALIEVERIDRSARESSDVVFVDNVVESTPWPFHYDIEAVLGADVNVEGFGLTGKLGGNLQVASSSDGITIGRGFLDINEGSFVVYGSPLTISRGRLSFDGGPVDNPGIDIKAVKMIEERREGYERIEVGANVIGSAAEFEVELYSVPKMDKGDILTYLLFDNPFSSEGDDGTTGLITSTARALGLGKGSDMLGDVNSMLPVDEIRLEGGVENQETSLVVGKNLSKELSVSYDYNLFKNAGSFRVRYEFGKGFSVESRNSFESNAVELLYSFER